MAGPSWIIRRADVADLEALVPFSVATYVAAFGASFKPDDLAAHLEAALSVTKWGDYLAIDTVLLALDGGTRGGAILGFVQFGPTPNADIAELRRLYVAPELQGRGIGTALLKQALLDPQLAEAVCIELDVWEHNSRAMQLYRQFGFTPTGRRAFRSAAGQITGHDIVMRRHAVSPAKAGIYLPTTAGF